VVNNSKDMNLASLKVGVTDFLQKELGEEKASLSVVADSRTSLQAPTSPNAEDEYGKDDADSFTPLLHHFFHNRRGSDRSRFDRHVDNQVSQGLDRSGEPPTRTLVLGEQVDSFLIPGRL
jgi:hypothetical protein